MAEVKLENVSKSYDKKNVIENVSLDIKDKEFLVLVGASGCGKSTLLRMIAGLEEITSGKIFIGERCVNNIHPKDRDIAMVFQSYALYPHMSVYENIAFGLKMRKFKKDEIDKRVKEASEILGLQDLLERKPKQLSGGQRQRVALGRAIVREPKVFLMDEPLSNLDAKLRVAMRSEIKKLHQRLQTTFIYVTHDQVEALTMGERIVVLDKGVIQQADTPEKIYHQPANTFVATFIGSFPMNLFDAAYENNRLKIGSADVVLNDKQVKLLEGRREILAGIRPENMSCGDFELNAPVEISEMLGSEKVVYFNLNNKKYCAKVPENYEFSDCITLKIDPENLLFFEKDTGKRI